MASSRPVELVRDRASQRLSWLDRRVQPHDLTAVEQAAAIRSGELEPVELVEHSLRRIERLDPLVAAFVTVTPERALDAAHAARKLLAGLTSRIGCRRCWEYPPRSRIWH